MVEMGHYRWFHGIFASTIAMPQVLVMPENARPAPTKPGKIRNHGVSRAMRFLFLNDTSIPP